MSPTLYQNTSLSQHVGCIRYSNLNGELSFFFRDQAICIPKTFIKFPRASVKFFGE
jgi:hypothetical protein